MVKKKEKKDKQLKYLVLIMVLIFIIVVFVYFAIWKTNHFEYLGLKWEKIKYDKLNLYYTKMLLTRHDGSQVYYNLYLRNDPRKLDIPINANIRLKADNFTYVTVDPDLQGCSGLSPSLVDLGGFLAAINLEAKTGLMNETEAEKNNVPYITCNDKKYNSVITLEKAGKKPGEENQTQISQTGDCFQIKIADCEVRAAVERFILGLLAYSKGERI